MVAISSSPLDEPFLTEEEEEILAAKQYEHLQQIRVQDFGPDSSDSDNLHRLFKIAMRSHESRKLWGETFKDFIQPFEGDLFDSCLKELLGNSLPSREMRLRVIQESVGWSSGQKAVFVILTSACVYMQYGSLLLLDEPEAFLHPPMLTSLLNTLSRLARRLNSVIIIVTHSPLVLQELPRQAVKIYDRSDGAPSVRLPHIETFGQNANEIIGEVFELDAKKTGFYRRLKKVYEHAESVQEVIDYFNGQIGSEGLCYLQILSNE